MFTLKGSFAHAAWSPDGQFLATGSWTNGDIELWSKTGARLLNIGNVGRRHEFDWLAWSPDSRRLAAVGNRQFGIWELAADGSHSRRTVALDLAGIRQVAWHPDGTRLALANEDGSIRIADPRTGDALLHFPGSRYVTLAWSSDGRRLATAHLFDDTARIWSASPGYPGHSRGAWSLRRSRKRTGDLAEHRAQVEQLRNERDLRHAVQETVGRRLKRATALQDEGRIDEATPVLEEALALCEASLDPKDWRGIIATSGQLALHYHKLGRYEDALALRERQLAGHLEEQESDSADVLLTRRIIAILQGRAGQHTRAVASLQKLIPLLKGNEDVEPVYWLDAECSLAREYMHLGNYEEAAAQFETTLPKLHKYLASDQVAGWNSWRSLTHCYSELGRHDEAVAHGRKVSDQCRELLGPTDGMTLLADYSLGVALARADRHEEAIEVFEILRKRLNPEISAPAEANLLGRLAAAYQSVGRPEDADKIVEERRALVRNKLEAAYDTAARASGNNHQTLIPLGATWRWFRPNEGADPAAADPDFFKSFHLPGFDDSQWRQGVDSIVGGFGYEEFEEQWIDEVDLRRHEGDHGHHLAFFRHRFTTKEPFEHLELHLQMDDGVVVFLNGKEVVREKMRRGPVNAGLQANLCRNHAKEWEVVRIPLPGPLQSGEHLLAISLHNHDCWNEDLRLAGVRLIGWKAGVEPSAAQEN